MGKLHDKEMRYQLQNLLNKNEGLEYWDSDGVKNKIINASITFANGVIASRMHHWDAKLCKKEIRCIKEEALRNKESD